MKRKSSSEEASEVKQSKPSRKVLREMSIASKTSPSIKLTQKESDLFAFLLKVQRKHAPDTTIRVAGGWVRDKLLGRYSDDIDVVLDNMTGSDFAQLINKYSVETGHEIHKVGIIKANPDQSKHLETATMHLGDEFGWVDFVNLRAETYCEHSRIPKIEFGTPLQDAERRDFTINTLFYNPALEKVEDFTGKGLDDLEKRIIRTPLEPRVTFLDDPLRALRAVRFASRFDFKVAEETADSLSLPEVADSLLHKISRERVGKELMGMITGTKAHPERAIGLLYSHGLCRSVFSPPEGQQFLDKDGKESTVNFDKVWDSTFANVSKMQSLVGVKKIEHCSFEGTEETAMAVRLRMLASALLPMASFGFLKKKKMVQVPYHIIRESLKFPSKDADRVANVILRNYHSFQQLANGNRDRVVAGLLLRRVGSLWDICQDVGCVDEAVRYDLQIDTEAPIVQKYNGLSKWFRSEGLIGVWDMKPLLNGKELMDQLGIKPGPQVKETQDLVIRWQLANPDGNKEACLDHIKAQRSY